MFVYLVKSYKTKDGENIRSVTEGGNSCSLIIQK